LNSTQNPLPIELVKWENTERGNLFSIYLLMTLVIYPITSLIWVHTQNSFQ